MNDEVFNLEVRKFLKHFGVTAQRELERAVRDGIESGTLEGNETLLVSARLTIEGLPADHVVEGRIALE